MKPNIANEIRAIRDRLGLTLDAMAKKLKVTGRTIWNWENNKSKVPAEKWEAIKKLDRKARP